MEGNSSILPFRVENEQVGHPISIAKFLSRIQWYLNNIIELQDSLRNISHFFGLQSEIWQDQCERAMTLVQTIKEPVGEFCKLLDSPEILPEDVLPLRYPLVITMHRMQKQVNDLMQLIHQFRAVCRTPSMGTIKQQQTIESHLLELLESSDELRRRVRILLDETDQMRLQEKYKLSRARVRR